MYKDVLRVSDLPELKKAHRKAVNNQQESFEFKGKVMHTQFAKYCIEYLEQMENEGIK